MGTVIEIEYEPPNLSGPCDCCGGKTLSLTRFVTQGGDAFGVVYMRGTPGRPQHGVTAAISVGKWWDGTTPEDRTAFALEFRDDPENYGVRVVDSATSPWSLVENLGRMLDREEALSHPSLPDVFHITDHLFQEDPDLRRLFDGEAS